MTSLYVLVVDKAWAKLYRATQPPSALTLVYHQALFGGRPADDGANDELARSLCRLLRADRQSGKFDRLVMLASRGMLEALQRQYDGEWADVTLGRIDNLPARYSDEDVRTLALHLLQQREACAARTAEVAGEARH